MLNAKISLETAWVGWIFDDDKKSQPCAISRDHSGEAAQGCDIFYVVTDLPAKTVVE
jgi:hypothetical protein